MLARRAIAVLFLSASCAAGEPAEVTGSGSTLPVGRPTVLAVRPHDPTSFTQGLVWADGRLWESSGQYGASRLVEVEPADGRTLRSVPLPANEFAEGLARVGDRLLQLTWQEGVVHVWSLPDLRPRPSLRFDGEGWGLTFDGERLIQSDGTARLLFRSPMDFALLGTVTVRRDGRPVPYLNELEWADGAVYANVWMSDEILRIDPETGAVTAVWDASGLLAPGERAGADVLNGIAWDGERRIFHLTGKYWPWRFEVELPLPGAATR